MTVLDLGGFARFWSQSPVRPRHVTVVNLDEDVHDEPWVDSVLGDACTYRGQSVDLVVSNSLIEHVGGSEQRRLLAETVCLHSDRHWVQTPYRYFPMEPHWVFPGFQFLPLTAQTQIGLHWPYGHIRAETPEESRREALGVELIGITELQQLFPRSEIWRERWFGLPKSIVAVSS